MPDEYPNLARAMRAMRAEHRDAEVLRLKRRCQELHSRIRDLERDLAVARGEEPAWLREEAA